MGGVQGAWSRRRRVGRARGVALVLAAAVVVTGCGADAGGAGEPKGDEATVRVFMVDGDGKLVPVDQSVGGAEQLRPQGRALAAVEALVHSEVEEAEGLVSHWGGRCAVGAKVVTVEREAKVVAVRVHGAAGVVCVARGARLTQQRQQLAWTVVENLGVDPATPVRLYGSNGGLLWKDVVAQEGILAG